MGAIYTTDEREYAAYDERCEQRKKTLYVATMKFVSYFIALGDDLAGAQAKVAQVSTEVNSTLYGYVLGNTQPLIDGINNSNLPFMDSAAKAKLVGDLSPSI
jgi:hypothetical protein